MMMNSNKNRVIVKVSCICIVVVLSCMVTGAGCAALPCSMVQNMVAPCASFLKGTGSKPPVGCCNSLKSLKQKVGNAAGDRRSACFCLKKAIFRSLKKDRLPHLNDQCQLNLPRTISISVNFNCNSIK
ncbi:non-specific lipid-transfer protein-like [Humulus lupulus]|uniref:non-specific lipid-transfer protein-like n=1 Tax=Humulus lupulus TaxID=3486 RepID=UPI002B4170C9|nr:non-specific lipid-transfer protein-like [Humulus lupulus]